MTTIICRPAERDLFRTSYSKSAGAMLTVPVPRDGRELNYMTVTVDGGPVDAFCYLHYSRVLAEYINTFEFECSMTYAEINERLTLKMTRHIDCGDIAVTAGTEMYDGGCYYRIKITPLNIDTFTFITYLEEAVRRIKTTDIVTCSTQDMLAVLGVNDQEKEKDCGMETRK